MPTLCELAAEIVKAHASITRMTAGELIQEIQNVYALLEALEAGNSATGVLREKNAAPVESVVAKAATKNNA